MPIDWSKIKFEEATPDPAPDDGKDYERCQHCGTWQPKHGVHACEEMGE